MIMEEIINDEHISLDYDDTRPNRDIYEYRLTTFDNNAHYENEIYLNKEQLLELYEGLRKLNFK